MSRSETKDSRLLTPTELARRLGVSLAYVYKNADAIPGCRRLNPRLLRFESRDVEEWIAAKTPPPEGPDLALVRTRKPLEEPTAL